ncbi:glycerol-3-phosphate 1-O-acyltransferase PlsY [Oscillospiraceae bacterium LTW-04]|nr:glycerol-3-phosphate 1-O-acyltransferase PlsY [Oscillospiraceae bacterium MB24-C1]
MEWILASLIATVTAYLMGSINCAVLFSTLFYGDDVRRHGSGNAGTTNMLRTYGAKAAALTFAGDILKGVFAVMLGRLLFSLFGATAQQTYGAYLSGYVAILGHMYPLYFRFKGGKGVATGLGAVCAINPPVFGVVFTAGIIIAGVSGFVSLASLSGAVLFPLLLAGSMLLKDGTVAPMELLLACGIALLVIYNHRENIKRLLSGTENKFYKKK